MSQNIRASEQSNWRCELFGTGPNGVIIRLGKGEPVPNAFWRLMQFLILGN
jgi:hypothetical protein